MNVRRGLALVIGMIAVTAAVLVGLSMSGLVHPQAVWSQTAAYSDGMWAANANTCAIDETGMNKVQEWWDAFGFKNTTNGYGTIEARCAVQNLPLYTSDYNTLQVSYWDGDGQGSQCGAVVKLVQMSNTRVQTTLATLNTSDYTGTTWQTRMLTFGPVSYDFLNNSYLVDIVIKRTTTAVPCSVGNVRVGWTLG